jgi:hypothetical protein
MVRLYLIAAAHWMLFALPYSEAAEAQTQKKQDAPKAKVDASPKRPPPKFLTYTGKRSGGFAPIYARTLLIDSGDLRLPADRSGIMQVLLGSTRVKREAIRDVLGDDWLSDTSWYNIIGEANQSPASERLFLFTVTLAVDLRFPDIEELKNSAPKLFNAIADRLSGRLRSISSGQRSQREDSLVDLKRQTSYRLQEIEHGEREIKDMRQRYGLLLYSDAREQLIGAGRARAAEKNSLEMELVGLKARRLKLEEQAARISNDVKTRLERETIVANLADVRDKDKATLDRMRKLFEASALSRLELDAAEKQLATSEAGLQREKLRILSAASAPVATINGETAQIDGKIAGIEAQIAYLEAAAAKAPFEKQLAAMDEIQHRERQIHHARALLNDVQRQVSASEMELIVWRQPTVMVLDD